MVRTIYLGTAGKTYVYIAEHIYRHIICLSVFTNGCVDRVHVHVKNRKDKDSMRHYKWDTTQIKYISSE